MGLVYNCGSELEFLEFIHNLREGDNIALISHIDLDGIASAKVMNQIITPKIMKLVHYEEINSNLVRELESEGINKVIITDLGMDNPENLCRLEEFCEVLIIDHHQFKKDLNSEKTVFINSKKYCASFICYSLVSKIKDVENIDWLVALACVADCIWEENLEFMRGVYEKYGQRFNASNPREGRFWELIKIFSLSIIYFQKNLVEFYVKIKEELDYVEKLREYSQVVKKELEENKQKFGEEKERIAGGWFFEVKSNFNIGSLLATDLSLKDKEEIIILSIKKDGGFYKISARENDMKRNMALLLQKATEGLMYDDAGGHVPAAGARVAVKDYREFKRRLKEFDLKVISVNK